MNSFVISFLAVVLVLTQDGAVATGKNELRRELLENYDKKQHPDNSVTLTYDITYRYCPTLDPDTGKLTSEIREREEWTDNRLKWPVETYDFDHIGLHPDDVWTPGVAIDEKTGEELDTDYKWDRVTLYKDGTLIRRREFQVSSNCEKTDGAWKCKLRFMSWKNHGPFFVMREGDFPTGTEYCDQIEEYRTQIEDIGGVASSFETYVIDMVIQPE